MCRIRTQFGYSIYRISLPVFGQTLDIIYIEYLRECVTNRCFFTVRKRSCGKVKFTSVCHSVHGGGGGVHPLGRHPLASPSWADTPPQQTASAADDTHPTGMHYCLAIDLPIISCVAQPNLSCPSEFPGRPPSTTMSVVAFFNCLHMPIFGGN